MPCPGGDSHITDGDARKNFQKEPLKLTLEIFIHRNSTGILRIIAKGHQVLLYMKDIDMSHLKNGLKDTVLTQSVIFFFLTP